MVTFAQLRASDPEAMDSLADAARKVGAAMAHDASDIGRHAEALGRGGIWFGKDAGSAKNRLGAQVKEYRQAEVAYGMIDSAVADLAEEVRIAKRDLDNAVHAALAIPARVSEDGKVSVDWDAFGPKPSPETVHKAKAAADQAVADMTKAIKAATAADERAVKAMAGLILPQDADPDTTAEAAQLKIGRSPEELKKWWASLTPQQRTDILTEHPELVAGEDGIPAADRDQANRVLLGREQQRVGTRLDEIAERLDDEKVPESERKALEEEKKKLLDTKRGLDAVDNRLNATDKERGYLLKLDTHGDGKVILSAGNPDTADNVVTYVPGTTTDLPGIAGDLDRSDKMQEAASKADPGADTAAITWLDYDAPDDLIDATQSRFADDAVRPLQNFQDGLRTTHEGAPSNNTLLGHSYGATTAATAADQKLSSVDNLVQVASPGTGSIGDAGRFDHIDRDRVYATRAPDDPIKDAANLGIHHADPIDRDFGGKVFPSSATTAQNPSAGGHSGYWDDPVFLGNLGNIVTGKYDKVQDGGYDE